MSDVGSRLHDVRARIATAAERAGRDPAAITLIAVSKKKPAEALRAAFDAGQRAFGENYLQEAREKQNALADLAIEWHFVGPLQSNKTKEAAGYFDWIHTIDRLKVARRLADQRPGDRGPLNVCLQVNLSGETTKSGVAPADLPALADGVAALPGLALRGLMALPAPAEAEAEQRAPFRRLRELRDSLNDRGLALDTLSMGMTADLEAAVLEGATHLRIGTAIFGAR